VPRKFAKESFDEEILIARQSFLHYIYPLFDKSSFLFKFKNLSSYPTPPKITFTQDQAYRPYNKTIQKVIKRRLREVTFAFKQNLIYVWKVNMETTY